MPDNSIGRIFSRLDLPRDCRILDVGGAPFCGEESIDYLIGATDQPIDIIAPRAEQADALRQKYGSKVCVVGGLGEIEDRSYDFAVVTPVLAQVSYVFRTLLAFEYAGRIRGGGFVAIAGIDVERAAAIGSAQLVEEAALFNDELDLRRVSPGTETARGLFRYLAHEPRKPASSSYFLWVTLERTAKPAAGRSNRVKWWRSLRSGDSRRLAATAHFLELFYDRFDRDPVHAFACLNGGDNVAPEAVHGALQALFNARRIKQYEAALQALETTSHGEVAFCHRLLLDRFDGVCRADLSQATARYRRLPESFFLKRAMLAVLIDLAALSLDRDTLLQLLGGEGSERLSTLPRAVAIGVCNALNALGMYNDCRALMGVYLAARPRIVQLQFIEVEHELFLGEGPAAGGGRSRYPGWRQVLDEVRAERSAALEGRLEPIETAAYSALAGVPDGRNNLLDIRFSAEQQRRLQKRIKDAVVAGEPLSLVRLGDGESYAFETSAGDLALRELTWWGQRPDDETRAEIASRVRDAVCDADILGIPSIHRILREIGDPAAVYGSNRTLRGLSSILAAVSAGGLLEHRMITEERCHQLIFDRGFLAELAGAGKRAIWVTCWSPAQLGVEHQPDCVFVGIPPHSRVRDLAKPGREPLFAVYHGKIEQMCRAVAPGSVVFVAAGLIGKIFVLEAKRRGAVALDIGAMADYLAGRKTRSSADIVEVGVAAGPRSGVLPP